MSYNDKYFLLHLLSLLCGLSAEQTACLLCTHLYLYLYLGSPGEKSVKKSDISPLISSFYADKSVRITPERPYSPVRMQTRTTVTPRKSVPVPTTYEGPQFDVSPIPTDALDEKEARVEPVTQNAGYHSPKKSPLERIPESVSLVYLFG